jgi:hypothetical protein
MSDKPSRPDLSQECDAHRYTCALLEEIIDSQHRIEEVQIRQEADIRHHIERTDAIQEVAEKLSTAVSSLEATRNQLIGAGKLFLGSSAVVALLKLLSLLL